MKQRVLILFFMIVMALPVMAQTTISYDDHPEIVFTVASAEEDVLYGDITLIAQSVEPVSQQLIVFIYSIDNVLIRQISLYPNVDHSRWQAIVPANTLNSGTYLFRLGTLDKNLQPTIWNSGSSHQVLSDLEVKTPQQPRAIELPQPVQPLLATSSPVVASSTPATTTSTSLLEMLLASSTTAVDSVSAESEPSFWCQHQSIKDYKQCQIIESDLVPRVCREASVMSFDDCDVYLSTLYIPRACNTLGPTAACFDDLLDRSMALADCGQSGPALCRQFLEDRRGFLMYRSVVVDALHDLFASTISSRQLTERYQEKDFSLKWPLVEEQSALIQLHEIESPALVSNDGFVRLWPAYAVSFDQDSDAMADDIEERFGARVDTSDSDGDGYSDYEEIVSSHSPVATSSTAITLAPWDSMMSGGKKLRLTTVDDEAQHNTIETITQFPNKLGLELHGQATALATVGIAIQNADIFFLASSQADAYGQWKLYWPHQLQDGVYEISPVVATTDGKMMIADAQLIYIQSGTLVKSDRYGQEQPRVEGISISTQPWTNYWPVMAGLFIVFAAIYSVILLKRRVS